MSRMFETITKTWQVFKGCWHDCIYCWAKPLVETRLKNKPNYRDGFTPRLIRSELERRFKPGEFIFIAPMGDIAFALPEELELILERVALFPETKFLLQTKDPKRVIGTLFDTGLELSENIYFGTTIETNRSYPFSKAPIPRERFKYLAAYPHPHKFLSIEPICDFDLETMLRWVELIAPEIIEIGADNYKHRLPEPDWVKVQALLKGLRELGPAVIEKDGLKRIEKVKEKCQYLISPTKKETAFTATRNMKRS